MCRYPWPVLRPLVYFQLDLVLQEMDAEGRVEIGPSVPLPGYDSLDALRDRLHALLDAFSDDAPFTLQRLAELLLEPEKQYTRLHKLVTTTTTAMIHHRHNDYFHSVFHWSQGFHLHCPLIHGGSLHSCVCPAGITWLFHGVHAHAGPWGACTTGQITPPAGCDLSLSLCLRPFSFPPLYHTRVRTRHPTSDTRTCLRAWGAGTVAFPDRTSLRPQ